MAIRYLKSSQVVPGKGMSYTIYEIEGEDRILRMLTVLPDVNEISLYPRPPVKKLFAPERCEQSGQEEFEGFWGKGPKERPGAAGG